VESALAGELAVSGAALAAAMAFNRAADVYIERVGEAAPVSPDLVLRHLPAVDVSMIYWWGAAAFVAFAAAVALSRERERLGYFARAYAVLVVARACLMTLTPLHIPEGAISVDGGMIYGSVGRMVTVHHDLFFSMHTAAPFLASLLFRDRWARRVCLAFAVLMGATVLLLKTHYSLDVAGAFLVTYSLYRLELLWLEPAVRRAIKLGGAETGVH
jgi:membrane-associated phospholipid phosphatase